MPLDERTLQNSWGEQFERKITGGKLSLQHAQVELLEHSDGSQSLWQIWFSLRLIPEPRRGKCRGLWMRNQSRTWGNSSKFSKNPTLQCTTQDLIEFSPPQCWTLNVDKTQCPVRSLETFAETGDEEIICPVKEENFQAETTKPESIILSLVLSILANLLPTISMVPRALSYIRPNQVIRWQGSHIDFSSFVIKPAASTITPLAMLLHTWRSLSMV